MPMAQFEKKSDQSLGTAVARGWVERPLVFLRENLQGRAARQLWNGIGLAYTRFRALRVGLSLFICA